MPIALYILIFRTTSTAFHHKVFQEAKKSQEGQQCIEKTTIKFYQKKSISHITISAMVAYWESLIRFAAEDGNTYWAALPLDKAPSTGLSVEGYKSIEELESGEASVKATVASV